MKLVFKNIDKDGSGLVLLLTHEIWYGFISLCLTIFILNYFIISISIFVRSIALIPEESEDMWHAYNLISEGDAVTASTVRKVQTESSTGSSTSSRVRTTLTITVETIDFDTQACVLRLKGRNIVENQYVKVYYLYISNLYLSWYVYIYRILSCIVF